MYLFNYLNDWAIYMVSIQVLLEKVSLGLCLDWRVNHVSKRSKSLKVVKDHCLLAVINHALPWQWRF